RVDDTNSKDGQHVALVHERLRNAILRGEIEAGATISQTALAEQVGAGRTPLREALRMLQREGLVISEPNRRVRIADLSGDDFEELYIMRLALECVAIRITVPRLTSDDFATLEGYMAQMDHYAKAEDLQGLRVPHLAFHNLLVSGAGPRVSEEIEQLFDHAERYRLHWRMKSPWADRQAEHRAILDAAAARDQDLAALRLAEHYAGTAGRVFAGIDPEHDLARLRSTMQTVAPGSENKLGVS
ncbi:MAG: GntR family transcriptional regulator, partial [Thermoleophilaceae bacterium]